MIFVELFLLRRNRRRYIFGLYKPNERGLYSVFDLDLFMYRGSFHHAILMHCLEVNVSHMKDAFAPYCCSALMT